MLILRLLLLLFLLLPLLLLLLHLSGLFDRMLSSMRPSLMTALLVLTVGGAFMCGGAGGRASTASQSVVASCSMLYSCDSRGPQLPSSQLTQYATHGRSQGVITLSSMCHITFGHCALHCRRRKSHCAWCLSSHAKRTALRHTALHASYCPPQVPRLYCCTLPTFCTAGAAALA